MRGLLEGHGYDVIEVEGDDLPGMHHRFAAALADGVRRGSAAIQAGGARRAAGTAARPRWPMIVLRTPEGLDRPGRGRRHPGHRHLALAPGAAVRGQGQPRAPARCSRRGCGPTGPRSSSTTTGAPDRAGPAAPTRTGDLRMSASPHANGGLLTARPRPARLPRLRASTCRRPASDRARVDARQLGELMRDVYRAQPRPRSGCSAPTRPTATGSAPSSRSPTGRSRSGSTADDVKLSHDGRVMEVLSRAQLPRLARGLHPDRPARAVRHLRGVRDGERLADDPAQQVAARRPTHLPWRAKVPSLNILLTSTAWRNDHNGFSPPGPGPDPERASPSAARSPGSTCRRTPTACCRWPTTASGRGRTST